LTVTISSTPRSNKRPCTLQQAAEDAKEAHGLDEVTDEVVRKAKDAMQKTLASPFAPRGHSLAKGSVHVLRGRQHNEPQSSLTKMLDLEHHSFHTNQKVKSLPHQP
jgi:hypothetical protein